MDSKLLYDQAVRTAEELCEKAFLKAGQIAVVGCSTSEICGGVIGKASVPEAAEAVFEGLTSVFAPRGIYLAAQCCEHLNRAIVISRRAVPFADEVCVVPKPKAGGSFAAVAFLRTEDPVVVEEIRAHAGLDIGETLIGMHLKAVAVPLRLENDTIGSAHVAAARTRPKYIGGERAKYE